MSITNSSSSSGVHRMVCSTATRTIVREHSLTTARSIPGVTRYRLVEEAIHLFSVKGYDATSVVEIQVACGLTAGSGALYKHLPSKKSLLEHAVRQHLQTMASRHDDGAAQLPDDPRQALWLIASIVWGVIDDDQDLIRIMLCEFDGRGWALSVALIALPYYQDTNPVIVAAARHTIDEVLADHRHTA